jgi:sporulation protein YlmC with PRC-barrel domain
VSPLGAQTFAEFPDIRFPLARRRLGHGESIIARMGAALDRETRGRYIMATDQIHVVPQADDAGVAPGIYAHLSDLKEYAIPEGEPDIRGWEVRLPDGRRVGKVEDLIIDTSDMSVRYLEVKVPKDVLLSDEDSWVLVPVSAARLDEDHDAVIVDRLPGKGLAGAPRFAHGNPTAEQDRALGRYYEPEGRTAAAQARDQQRFWGKRRAGREGAPYLRSRGGTIPPVEAVVVEEVIVEGVVPEPAVRRADGVDRRPRA